jgi:hypothetical protein
LAGAIVFRKEKEQNRYVIAIENKREITSNEKRRRQ